MCRRLQSPEIPVAGIVGTYMHHSSVTMNLATPVAYETNYRPSYVPRSITHVYFGSERRGLYERIPLSFASVDMLVRLSNSSPVASALPIYNYD